MHHESEFIANSTFSFSQLFTQIERKTIYIYYSVSISTQYHIKCNNFHCIIRDLLKLHVSCDNRFPMFHKLIKTLTSIGFRQQLLRPMPLPPQLSALLYLRCWMTPRIGNTTLYGNRSGQIHAQMCLVIYITRVSMGKTGQIVPTKYLIPILPQVL